MILVQLLFLFLLLTTRGPLTLFFYPGRLTDSRGGRQQKRRRLFPDLCLKGHDSRREVLLAPGTPMVVTLRPFGPPAPLIDVCRCACLHDNGLHWGRRPPQCLSINQAGDGVKLPFQCVCVCMYWRGSMLHYWWSWGVGRGNSSSSVRGAARCCGWEGPGFPSLKFVHVWLV